MVQTLIRTTGSLTVDHEINAPHLVHKQPKPSQHHSSSGLEDIALEDRKGLLRVFVIFECYGAANGLYLAGDVGVIGREIKDRT